MKIHPVVAELFHACGHTDKTDMTKIIVAFRNSANTPKTQLYNVMMRCTVVLEALQK
jgi:hypothetical protein